MFFPERITNIKSTDRVLEVGPGGTPHPRSDVFLEKVFDDASQRLAQRGFAPELNTNKKTVFYEGKEFPFEDNEFDYVICSHVIEHIKREDFSLFISELQRVAKKGYIEFPNALFELINYQDVHLWFMNYRNGSIYLLDKELFSSSFIHKAYREMFYSSNEQLHELFNRHKEFFFCGFEWHKKICYSFVSEWDELINQYDFELIKAHLALTKSTKKMMFFGTDIVKVYDRYSAFFTRKLKALLTALFIKQNYTIDKTAQIQKKSFVKLGKNAEIKDFVIIRTYTNLVSIGDNSQINPFCVIYGGSGIQIGKNVMIGPHCVLAAGNHDYKQTEKPMRFAGNLSKGPIVIGDNVWIGAGCTITDGVIIGRDAVIGANSVVTKNVAPFDIVGGVPAKVINNRLTSRS